MRHRWQRNGSGEMLKTKAAVSAVAYGEMAMKAKYQRKRKPSRKNGESGEEMAKKKLIGGQRKAKTMAYEENIAQRLIINGENGVIEKYAKMAMAKNGENEERSGGSWHRRRRKK